jgi:glycosyltransferase involved in cell wall biosynthesis
MDLHNKKILLVIHQGALGGAERQALGLSKYLTGERGCIVDLLLTFSNETTKEFDSYAKECAVNTIFHFGSPYLLCKRKFSYRNLQRLVWSIKYLLKLRKGLAPIQHDVIIPFLNFPSKVSYFLYKLIPSVKFTFWHQLGLDSINLDVFEYIAVNNIPCVIGNAPNCLDMFKNEYVIDKKKLNILTQYISLESVDKNKKELREKFNIPDNKIVIGMIAQFRYDKYHDVVLNVFIKLQENYPQAHLLFLGNKYNNKSSKDKFINLSKRTENNNLSQSVTLLSNVDVNDVLNLMDIGVLISLIEGTPNAVMEYMLYGLPVVASNHPGCQGLLKDSPFLVKNEESLIYEKLVLLIESKDLRIAEGLKNVERIKEYDVASYVKKLEVIMNKTLN